MRRGRLWSFWSSQNVLHLFRFHDNTIAPWIYENSRCKNIFGGEGGGNPKISKFFKTSMAGEAQKDQRIGMIWKLIFHVRDK